MTVLTTPRGCIDTSFGVFRFMQFLCKHSNSISFFVREIGIEKLRIACASRIVNCTCAFGAVHSLKKKKKNYAPVERDSDN